MMILRTDESQNNCVEWVPFGSNYGQQHGFPNRAVQAVISSHQTAAVARASHVGGTVVGNAISGSYTANLLDSSHQNVNYDDGYEILVVGDSCSTAWVPYTAGDPVPATAVVAGKDTSNRNYYVVGPDAWYFYIGGYVEGDVDAYYSSTSGTSSIPFVVDILMLITLH